MHKIQLSIILIAFIAIVSSKEAFAYLDPGSGSYMIQILIGLFLGGFFTLKLYWRRLRAFFSKDKQSEETEK